MRKKIRSNKSFFNKYGKLFFFSFLFVLSIGVSLYFVFASDDSDQNKFTVSNIKISNLVDGSEPWDSDNSAGNDSNGNNGIVRNFDSINYEVSFDLGPKPGQSVNMSVNRTVIVDFILPTAIDGNVIAGTSNSNSSLTKVFGNYSYAEFTLSLTPGTNRINFSLSDINATNGTVLSPIIAIKESTDNDKFAIEQLSYAQRDGSYNAVESLLNKSTTCTNTIDGSNSCSVSVTGVTDYFINLYQGSTIKDDMVTNFPIGIMVGLNGRKIGTEDKGKKGLLVPTQIDFDIKTTTTTDNAGNLVNFIENSARSYKQNGLNYKVYIDSNNSIEMPEVYNGDEVGNGDIEVINSENGIIKLRLSNIKNNLKLLDGTNMYYLSTNAFEFSSERTSDTIDRNIGNININVNAYDSNKSYSSIDVVDYYSRFVGTYESKIDLFDSKDDTMDSKNQKPDGKAILNYNEEFYIKNSFQYATQSGDGLDDLTNYIKLDNEAIDIILNNDGMEYDITTGIIDVSKNAPYIDKETGEGITFYYGEWNTNYFERTVDADNYGCPSDISSKETLMNLYGGPCIKETNLVKKTHYLNGEVIDGDPLTEEEITRGPLIVQSKFVPAESDEYVNPTSTGTIYLKAQIKNNSKLVNSAHQIVTSATGMFTDTNGNTSLYYLSNQVDHSGTDIMSNPSNYSMTNYDFNQRQIVTNNSTVCENLTCAVTGNTILVSAVRVSKPSVETFYNDVETTDFYYYPIEFRIDANAYRNDIAGQSFDSATIDVLIPNYLRYSNAEVIKDSTGDYESNEIVSIDPISITPVEIGGIQYNKLSFKFESEDIVMGSIPKLKVFTNIYLNTPNNSEPTVFVRADYVVNTNVVNPDSTITTVKYSSVDSDVDRTTNVDNLIIHNNADVTTQGTVSPRYIERNKSYEYTMQAYNNSSYTYNNAGLFYVLPYKGDSSYSDLESNFEATDLKVALVNALPSGYKAYYTTGSSANIINYEINDNQNKGYSWVEWNNPTTEINNITAIKIVKQSSLTSNEFFGGEDGIKVRITPVNSSVGDTFYNNFYIISDRPSGLSCSNGDVYCNDSLTTSKVYYSSSRELVSVYNRIISGFVWEDYDYSGLYDNEESRLENIPVSLYKISDQIENPDSNDPTSYVDKEGEEWIADTLTDSNGRYTFRGLDEGMYYVKYTYDDKKYTITKKGAGIVDNVPGANSINSKALSYPDKNFAVSSIVKFEGNNNSSVQNLNLGLTIRKQFSIDIKKFITNVTLTSDNGTESHDYDNATTVTLNVRNPRNMTARVTYNFVVENTKYFPGYIGIIADMMPYGMRFNPSIKENQDWALYGNTIYYTGLSGRLLIPNEKYYFSLVLDMDVTEGGDFVNTVAVKDLTLMGDELPSYDFNSLDIFGTNQIDDGYDDYDEGGE